MPSVSESTCLATVLTDRFVPGFAVFITSLLEKNPGFDLPVVLIHGTTPAWSLSPESKELARSYYANLQFHEVREESYAKLLTEGAARLNTPRRLRSAFFIIEAFGLREFQKVVTFDSDMICLGDIQGLLEISCEFGAVPTKTTEEGPSPYFNSGLMLIGPSLLASDLREKLLRMDLTHPSLQPDPLVGKADQAILNHYFGLHGGYHVLPDRFNFSKRRCPDGPSADAFQKLLESHQVALLHYVARKPWDLTMDEDETCYVMAESLWHRQFWKVADSRLALRLARIQEIQLQDLRKNWEKAASLRSPAGAGQSLFGALKKKIFKSLGFLNKTTRGNRS